MNVRLPLARQPSPSGSSPAGEPSEAGLMQIGDLAKETGKTVRALHLYEQLGLLTPAARSKGRYRLYGPEALVRIRWIAKLQEMGFSLSDLQVIVREYARVESAPTAMRRMREVYARKLEEAREHRRRIEALERDLELSLKYLDTCDVCDPRRLVDACDCCDLHDREVDVPELVRGFRAQPASPADVEVSIQAAQATTTAASATALADPKPRAAAVPPHSKTRW